MKVPFRELENLFISYTCAYNMLFNTDQILFVQSTFFSHIVVVRVSAHQHFVAFLVVHVTILPERTDKIPY